MEAMACETPVVGTEVGGIPTAVDAGETGYLVPKDGISELAGRMEELLGDSREHERMAQASRTWAVEHGGRRSRAGGVGCMRRVGRWGGGCVSYPL